MVRLSTIAWGLSAWIAGVAAASALTLTSPDVKQGGKIADEQVFNSWAARGRMFRRR